MKPCDGDVLLDLMRALYPDLPWKREEPTR